MIGNQQPQQPPQQEQAQQQQQNNILNIFQGIDQPDTLVAAQPAEIAMDQVNQIVAAELQSYRLEQLLLPMQKQVVKPDGSVKLEYNNPLAWWKSKRNRFPILSRLAQKIFVHSSNIRTFRESVFGCWLNYS
eukprot:gene26867-32469_t